MPDNDPNYRDPKVTTTSSSSGGIGKWIGIAAAVILGLLLLSWLFGLFDDDVDTTVVPTDNDGTTVIVPEGTTVTPSTD